ncbi:hypothetical protein P4S72_07390 [Vibrio sp. PP-XX7]
MKDIKYLLFGALMLIVFSSRVAQALELSVDSCITEPTQITDMAFVTPNKAILTTRPGTLYWFNGCGQPIEKIATLTDVDSSDWQHRDCIVLLSNGIFTGPTGYMFIIRRIKRVN